MRLNSALFIVTDEEILQSEIGELVMSHEPVCQRTFFYIMI